MFFKTKRTEILFLDTIGVNWIRDCIPSGCHVTFLDFRGNPTFPRRIRYFLFVLLNALRDFSYLVHHPKLLHRFSLIDFLNPRLLVTCSDNSPWLHEYSRRRKVPTILIQTATRSSNRRRSFLKYLPTYLGFGALEQDIFFRNQIQIETFRSIGSVKLGIAKDRFSKMSYKNSYDLLFISHFRPHFLEKQPSAQTALIDKCQKFLFSFLVRYATERGRAIAIASKTRGEVDYPLERLYFQELAGERPLDYVAGDKGQNEFATYFAGFTSQTIVTPFSTLGFELLSSGKKVLFGASGVRDAIEALTIQPYFDALPDEVKLHDDSFEEFCEKLDALSRTSCESYQSRISAASQAIISFNNSEMPQDRIRSQISDILESKKLD